MEILKKWNIIIEFQSINGFSQTLRVRYRCWFLYKFFKLRFRTKNLTFTWLNWIFQSIQNGWSNLDLILAIDVSFTIKLKLSLQLFQFVYGKNQLFAINFEISSFLGNAINIVSLIENDHWILD